MGQNNLNQITCSYKSFGWKGTSYIYTKSIDSKSNFQNFQALQTYILGTVSHQPPWLRGFYFFKHELPNFHCFLGGWNVFMPFLALSQICIVHMLTQHRYWERKRFSIFQQSEDCLSQERVLCGWRAKRTKKKSAEQRWSRKKERRWGSEERTNPSDTGDRN